MIWTRLALTWARRAVLPLALLVLLAPGDAMAIQATLAGDADLSRGKGKAAILGALPHLTAAAGRSSVLLRFEFDSLPEGFTPDRLERAILKLWVSRTSGGTLEIHRAGGPWTESGEVPGRRTGPAGGPPETEISVGPEEERGFITADLTGLVRAWIAGAVPNDGIVLVARPAGAVIVFHSKENRAGGHEPALEMILGTSPGGGQPPDTQALLGPPGPPGPPGADGPPGPPGAALNPLRIAMKRWYEANQTGFAASTGLRPVSVLYDGYDIWVANYDSGTVAKHERLNGMTLGTRAVGNGPADLVYDGRGTWVANSLDDQIMKLESASGNLLGTFPAGDNPVALCFDGHAVWVANAGDGTVSRLRAQDGFDLGTFTVGTDPRDVAFDGTSIWVANTGDNTVTRLQASDGALLGTYPAGVAPRGLAWDGDAIWVASSGNDTVLKLDPSDGSQIASVPTGTSPYQLIFDGTDIWVTNNGSGDVTKIRANDATLVGTYAAGTGPEGIAFDGVNIWVANSLSDSVTKL